MSAEFVFQEYVYLFNYLLALCFFYRYYKLWQTKNFIIVLIFISITIFSGIYLEKLSVIIGLLFFFPFIFLLFQTKNYILSAVFVVLLNALLSIPWFLTVDVAGALYYFDASVLFLSILNLTLFFLCLLILRYFLRKFDLLKVLTNVTKQYRLLSSALLIGLLLNYIIRFIVLNHTFIERVYSSVVSFGYIGISVTVCYIVLKKNQQNEYLKTLSRAVEQEKENMKTLEEFQHDYKGLLITLTRYIEIGENQEALQLIQQETGYVNALSNDEEIRIVQQIGIAPLQNLFIHYMTLFKQKGLNCNIQILGVVDVIEMGLFDFVRCVNILLNNAYESAVKSAIIKIEKTPSSLLLTVWNDYKTSEDVDMEKIVKRNYSTKGNKRGKGLYIVSKIASRYRNVDFDLSIDGQFFVATIYIGLHGRH